MGKSTHFTGQPLYCQLLNLADKDLIKEISRSGGHDHYVKKFDGYSHLVTLLYGVLMQHTSLREIVVGMLSDAHKLKHIGINDIVKRSTLSDANNRRSSDFFSEVYFSLFNKYKTTLSDSVSSKPWEKLLHIMDSTTISLFSNILKGVGRHPKHGKKKGGVKVHTVLKATEGVPYSIHFTSAATHDHVMLKKLELSNGSFIAMDRAYIDYKVFEEFTQKRVFYVTKMKKNMKFEPTKGHYLVNSNGLVVLKDSVIQLEKGDIKHTSRRIEYWEEGKKKSTVLLTNNLELDVDDVIEIYKRRWQIELLFKQLKQNFPLKYFFGESVNAIQSQIWVVLIANLLLTVVKKRVKNQWSFSNLVTMVRQTLMYYIDMYSFCENPEKAWMEVIKKRSLHPPEPTLFD